LNKNRNSLVLLVSAVVVSAVLTFIITASIFIGWKQFYPDSIKFDTSQVKSENIAKFNTVRNLLKSEYYENVNENTLLEGAISGMVSSLGDRYTSYFSAQQWQSIQEDILGSFTGVGITITRQSDGSMQIDNVYSDSPAMKIGIKVNDRIIKVEGEDIRAIKDKAEVFDLVRGTGSSKVKLTIFRPADEKIIDFDIVKGKIKVDNIQSKMLPDSIGYIRIDKFDGEIASFFNQKLDSLISNGMKGLIIDVRDDPGGYYDQVCDIADRLLPKDVIVYTEDKFKVKKIEYSDSKELGLPLVILINGNSASASEILSGAIKDNKKGILIGTKTFGKGLVQKPTPLGDGSGLNITIARYFTPSGICIHGIGIMPDIEVEPALKYKTTKASEIPKEEDLQLLKAIEVIGNQIIK